MSHVIIYEKLLKKQKQTGDPFIFFKLKNAFLKSPSRQKPGKQLRGAFPETQTL